MKSTQSFLITTRQASLFKQHQNTSIPIINLDCSELIPCSETLQFDPSTVGSPFFSKTHKSAVTYSKVDDSINILCKGLADCYDSTIRIIAERLQIPIINLRVKIEALAALTICKNLPIGVQKMICTIEIQAASTVKHKQIKRLLDFAKSSCTNYQALVNSVELQTEKISTGEQKMYSAKRLIAS